MERIFVTKADRQKEAFSEKKVRHSIRRAGISSGQVDEVVRHIKDILYPDITTAEIYDHIIEFLEKTEEKSSRGKYSLKKTIMDLGPSGYPFEKYIASVLTNWGYFCQTNLIIPGRCVSHEVDIIARKDEFKYMIECKFHNRPGTRTAVKVALYVHSRFEDILGGKNEQRFNKAMIVTNTKCTTDVIAYSQCVGMDVLAWGYPKENNLQDLIEGKNLYPITVLRSISAREKEMLLAEGIATCKDLQGRLDQSLISRFPSHRKREVAEELEGYM